MRSRLLLWLFVLASCASAPPPDPAQELAEALVAPCCWRQTLADHESPLAHELRGEIATRIAAGESPASIEAAFVGRYGDRVRARGNGPDPRLMIGAVTAALTAAGLLVVILVFRRGRRGQRDRRGPVPAATSPRLASPDPVLSERLDDELADADD